MDTFVALFLLGNITLSLIVGFGSGLLRKRVRMKTVAATEAEWLKLCPDHSRYEWFIAGLYLLGTTGIPLLVVSARFFYAEAAGASGGRAFLALAACIALAEAAWTARSYLALKTLGDADVQLTLAPIKRGEPFELRIAVPAGNPAQSEIAARIICIEHALLHFGRFAHMKHTNVREIPLAIASACDGAGRVAGTAQLRVPAENCPPSGHGKSLNYTYEWQLRVELPGGKNASSVFPLDVV